MGHWAWAGPSPKERAALPGLHEAGPQLPGRPPTTRQTLHCQADPNMQANVSHPCQRSLNMCDSSWRRQSLHQVTPTPRLTRCHLPLRASLARSRPNCPENGCPVIGADQHNGSGTLGRARWAGSSGPGPKRRALWDIWWYTKFLTTVLAVGTKVVRLGGTTAPTR